MSSYQVTDPDVINKALDAARAVAPTTIDHITYEMINAALNSIYGTDWPLYCDMGIVSKCRKSLEAYFKVNPKMDT